MTEFLIILFSSAALFNFIFLSVVLYGSIVGFPQDCFLIVKNIQREINRNETLDENEAIIYSTMLDEQIDYLNSFDRENKHCIKLKNEALDLKETIHTKYPEFFL